MSSADRRPESVSTRPDYAAHYAAFRPADVAAKFTGDFETGINVCVECCDAHLDADHPALEWEAIDGRRLALSFPELRDRAARFADVIAKMGVKPGDVISGMLPRCPELIVTILGAWRAGAVYQPLFTAFGPKAIEHRVKLSRSKLVVTDPTNRPKLEIGRAHV